MESAQHGERGLAVQLADVPVVALENELARKKDAVREIGADSLSELGELFDGIDAEAEISSRREATVVKKRKAAGAIAIGKANTCEFAAVTSAVDSASCAIRTTRLAGADRFMKPPRSEWIRL